MGAEARLALLRRKAGYAGSFDPPTEGHMYMIREGAAMFDELVVAIGHNPDKRALFPLEERLSLLRSSVRDHENVSVSSFESRYLIDYAHEIGARYVLRGIRNSTDFSFEQTMRNVNGDRNPAVTTVFLMPPRDYAEVSSTMIKGLVGPDGWEEVLRKYVPPAVHRRFIELALTKSA